jgi:hypothetical protein
MIVPIVVKKLNSFSYCEATSTKLSTIVVKFF